MNSFFLSKRVMRPKNEWGLLAAEIGVRGSLFCCSRFFPVLSLAVSVPAQTATSVIRGTVQDSTGAVIVEVNVLLLDAPEIKAGDRQPNEDGGLNSGRCVGPLQDRT
jgi:hypothetical protein